VAKMTTNQRPTAPPVRIMARAEALLQAHVTLGHSRRAADKVWVVAKVVALAPLSSTILYVVAAKASEGAEAGHLVVADLPEEEKQSLFGRLRLALS